MGAQMFPYILLSTGLAIGSVVYAFLTREHFYAAMVYLATSKISLVIMGNFAVACTYLCYNLLISVFFGRLNDSEWANIAEKMPRAIVETGLAMMAFADDFGGTSLLLFGGLLLCKVLHWILDSRVNYLETQPAISRLQHARLASFLAILAVCDYHLLLFSVSRALARPYSVVLFFAFEYIKLVVLDAYILLKYAVATASHAIPSWDGRSAAVMYLELLHSFALAVLVTGFFMVVLSGRHFPIHMIHEVIVTADSFRRRLVKVLKYRAVMANVGSAFSDATQEDLERIDHVCIICRETMVPDGGPKKLPCNHCFHLECLRGWMEHNHSCPICRADVNRRPASEPQPGAGAPAPGPRQADAPRPGPPQGRAADADRVEGAARVAPGPRAAPAPAPAAPTVSGAGLRRRVAPAAPAGAASGAQAGRQGAAEVVRGISGGRADAEQRRQGAAVAAGGRTDGPSGAGNAEGGARGANVAEGAAGGPAAPGMMPVIHPVPVLHPVVHPLGSMPVPVVMHPVHVDFGAAARDVDRSERRSPHRGAPMQMPVGMHLMAPFLPFPAAFNPAMHQGAASSAPYAAAQQGFPPTATGAGAPCFNPWATAGPHQGHQHHPVSAAGAVPDPNAPQGQVPHATIAARPDAAGPSAGDSASASPGVASVAGGPRGPGNAQGDAPDGATVRASAPVFPGVYPYAPTPVIPFAGALHGPMLPGAQHATHGNSLQQLLDPHGHIAAQQAAVIATLQAARDSGVHLGASAGASRGQGAGGPEGSLGPLLQYAAVLQSVNETGGMLERHLERLERELKRAEEHGDLAAAQRLEARMAEVSERMDANIRLTGAIQDVHGAAQWSLGSQGSHGGAVQGAEGGKAGQTGVGDGEEMKVGSEGRGKGEDVGDDSGRNREEGRDGTGEEDVEGKREREGGEAGERGLEEREVKEDGEDSNVVGEIEGREARGTDMAAAEE